MKGLNDEYGKILIFTKITKKLPKNLFCVIAITDKHLNFKFNRCNSF